MNILAADDEPLMLEALIHAIQKAMPSTAVHGFQKATELLNAADQLPCDVAFLDIQMRGTDGLELAKRLKEKNANINIIFVTGYDQYTGNAMQLHASGYIAKPVTAEKVAAELSDLRYPVVQETGKRVRVQCFGNFEVFADGKPMDFRYNKTRELFAYLVDRKGAAVTAGELRAVLWEDKMDSPSLRGQLRNLISDLTACLKRVEAENVLMRLHRNYAVNPAMLDCDYFDFLERKISAINAYTGEYMTQYSWSEITIGALERMQK